MANLVTNGIHILLCFCLSKCPKQHHDIEAKAMLTLLILTTIM